MNADETPAELRVRLSELAADATERPWTFDWADDCQVIETGDGELAWLDERRLGDAAFIVALVNAWPTIDALLARLTIAEEENDELHEDLVRMMRERNAAIARLTAAEADASHEPVERPNWDTKITCECGERCSNWMEFHRHRGDAYRAEALTLRERPQ